MRDSLLEIDGIAAGYGGRPVLDGLSLTIRPKQRVGLIGPNGCGKSTLLRAIVGEVPEVTGSIHFHGSELRGLETSTIVNRGIGYLRQTHNIFPGLTVEENLEIASANGRSRNVRDREQLLKAFPALDGREKTRAGLMSGGERQALAVAMILMHPVSLLLLDEPLAGLSQKAANELLEGIARLHAEEGFALILVEHRLNLIRPHLDRVVVMVRGRIEEDTRDTRLLEDPERLGHLFVI